MWWSRKALKISPHILGLIGILIRGYKEVKTVIKSCLGCIIAIPWKELSAGGGVGYI